MKRYSPSLSLFAAVAVLALAVVACNLTTVAPATEPAAPVETEQTDLPPETTEEADTPEPTATIEIVHTMFPGEPPASWVSEITDRDSSITASERRTSGGDNFALNTFERPFNANSMDTYFPDLDIKRARLSMDGQWIYVTIQLVGVGPNNSLRGNYGVEVDLNVNGRGDLLIFASDPQAAWSTDGVRAWEDSNNDVGGAHPIQSDAPVSGDGYDTLVFDQGLGADSDAAWARVSPADPASVQIAFKKSLINNDAEFTWGAWADKGVANPAWFDYNDHFTHAEAGSPMSELSQYPVKALAEVDNTCRWGVGFTPIGNEPGVCPVPPTPTPIVPGTITGVVFNDGVNGDRILDAGSIRIAGANVRVRSGACSSPGSVVTTATTSGSGSYVATVNPGTYCVDVNPDPPIGWSDKTPPQTVNVSSGAAVNNVNFGYSQYLGMR